GPNGGLTVRADFPGDLGPSLDGTGSAGTTPRPLTASGSLIYAARVGGGRCAGQSSVRTGRRPPEPAAESHPAAVQAVQALQRSAGNAAVAQLIERSRAQGLSTADARPLNRSATAED